MAADRSIAALVRESLGLKAVLRFFPNPEPNEPPSEEYIPYNADAFDDMVDTALWWLGDAAQIRITETITLPASGRIELNNSPTSIIRKVVSVKQGDDYFHEVRADWSEGTPIARGAWFLDPDAGVFYAVGVGKSPIPFGVLARFAWLSDVSFSQRRLLQPGPVTITYFGVPTEEQIEDNAKLKQAAVDYAVALALEDMIPRILRPKNVRLEGVPDIRHNAADYRKEAEARRQSAMRVAEHGIYTV